MSIFIYLVYLLIPFLIFLWYRSLLKQLASFFQNKPSFTRWLAKLTSFILIGAVALLVLNAFFFSYSDKYTVLNYNLKVMFINYLFSWLCFYFIYNTITLTVLRRTKRINVAPRYLFSFLCQLFFFSFSFLYSFIFFFL